MSEFRHVTVLLQEAVDELKVHPGGTYVDATVGGGGHTKEIIGRGGVVLAIDQDPEAIKFIQESQKSNINLSAGSGRGNLKLVVAQGNFRDIKKISAENGFDQVEGIIFDLGVSSFQLDQSGRGFSMRRDEPLDMRMSTNDELTALKVVNTYTSETLAEIFLRYGEEIKAKMIADEIVRERKVARIASTKELSDIVMRIIPRAGDIHPATKVFQAIRIEVNQELEALRLGLQGGYELIKPGGRLVVISFHSLEDRIVKQTMRAFEQKGYGKIMTRKPIIPSEKEVRENRRSRSAKMRVFEVYEQA